MSGVVSSTIYDEWFNSWGAAAWKSNPKDRFCDLILYPPLFILSGYWRWNGETSWTYGRNKKMAIQWQRVFGCGFFQGDSDAFFKLWFITLPTLSWAPLSSVVGKTNCSRRENGAGKLQPSAERNSLATMTKWEKSPNYLNRFYCMRYIWKGFSPQNGSNLIRKI